MGRTEPTKPWAATRRDLADAIGEIDGVLPGSVVVRHMRCGKQRCACKADPPALHGPYIQWTRTVNGKTVTRFLTEEQLGRYQAWFDNARRLKELVAKLEIATVHAVEQTEGWQRQSPPKETPARAEHPARPAHSKLAPGAIPALSPTRRNTSQHRERQTGWSQAPAIRPSVPLAEPNALQCSAWW